MDSWKSLIVVLTLIAITSFCLISFVYVIEVSNNQNNTILSAGPLSTFNSSLGSSMNSFSNSATAYKNATEQEQNTLTQPTGALTVGSIFTSAVRFSGFIYSFTASIFTLIGYLGVPVILLGLMTSLLIVIVALLWWRLIKWGQ
jgi:hypothetical protein